MTSIHITRTHQLSHDAARTVAESVAADLQAEYGLQYAWDTEVLRFHTFGVRGDLHVGMAEIVLNASLGAWLAPFRDRLESEINRHFDLHFQESEGQSPAEQHG